MDRKSIVILSVSFLLLIAWYPMVGKLYPQQNQRLGTNGVAAASQSNAPSATAATPTATDAVKTAAALPAALAPIATPANAKEQIIEIKNDLIRLNLSSFGGGIKTVELLKYPESTDPQKKGEATAKSFVKLNTFATAPAMSLIGSPALQGDGIFTLIPTPTGARAEKLLPNGLAIVKEFTIGKEYIVGVRTRLENRGAEPVAVPAHEWLIGASGLRHTTDDPRHVLTHWYNGSKDHKVEESWFRNYTLGCVPGTPRAEYADGNGSVHWASVNSQFFTLAAITPTNAPAQEVVSRHLDLPAPTPEQLKADPKLHTKPTGQQLSFRYPSSVLVSKAVLERSFDFYAGPKEYRTLAKIGQDRGNDFDLIMDFGSFFGLFSKGLLLSMNLLHSWGLPYGLAIITITVIIKLLFWPLTKASTQSMKRMAALQPQMKAIQERYKDDPKKMNVKLMEFMRDNKVSPLGGCLPMLFQIPVFIGFFFMIQTAIELRGASFLWASDLSQPDTVAVILGLPINVLPLLMGITQLWQIRLTPPSPGMDPVQQKIMQYMPLMFMFFLYHYAAGLTLYWTVQNLLSIAQMKLTKNEPVATAPSAQAGRLNPGRKG